MSFSTNFGSNINFLLIFSPQTVHSDFFLPYLLFFMLDSMSTVTNNNATYSILGCLEISFGNEFSHKLQFSLRLFG